MGSPILPTAEQVIAALQNKRALHPCPRCNTGNFTFVGFSNIYLTQDLSIMSLGGPAVPCAVVLCKHCGYTCGHALKALELL